MADIQSEKANAPARETAGSRLAAKRAAKAARKASQRGTTNPAEEVAKSLHQANAWIDEHGRWLWVALGAIVLIAIGWFGVSTYAQRQERAGGDLLHTALVTSKGIIVGPEDTAPEDPIVPVFSSVKEREDKALKEFRAVIAKYPSSHAARYALLGEGNALLALDKSGPAADVFSKLLQNTGDDTYLRFRALEGAGYALEGQKKYGDALARFRELSKLHNGDYRTLGDYHQARMLVAQGKPDAARSLLETTSKAAADRPAEQGEELEFAQNAVQTLLTELGGKPTEPSGKANGLSQSVLDALRKQLAKPKK